MKYKELQRTYLLQAIIEVDGNIMRMVEKTGLSRSNIYRMIKSFKFENDLAAARLSQSKRRRSETDLGGGYQ